MAKTIKEEIFILVNRSLVRGLGWAKMDVGSRV